MPKRDYATKQTKQHDARLKEPTRHLLLHPLLHLPSNQQGQTRRLLPHVSLKTPYAKTPLQLNHLKLMMLQKERRRNQDIRMHTVNTP